MDEIYVATGWEPLIVVLKGVSVKAASKENEKHLARAEKKKCNFKEWGGGGGGKAQPRTAAAAAAATAAAAILKQSFHLPLLQYCNLAWWGEREGGREVALLLYYFRCNQSNPLHEMRRERVRS